MMPKWATRQKLLPWLLLVASVVWVLALYLANYPVRAHAESLEKQLARKWGEGAIVSLVLLDEGSIQEQAYIIGSESKSVLYHVTLDDKTYLGFAELTPGLAGRYRFSRIAHSFSSLFYASYEQLAGQNGFLVIGLNPRDFRASRVAVGSGGNSIDLEIVWRDVFSCFLPAETTVLNDIALYGHDGRDLTPAMAERYPSLQPQGTATRAVGTETPWYNYLPILLGGSILALWTLGR